MKKIFRTVAALAVVMFAGCTNDLTNEVVAPIEGGKTTVTVGIADTKIYIGDLEEDGTTRKMFWHSGDKLGINGNASTAIERSEDKTSATFTFDTKLTAPYEALYPAPAYVDAQTIHLNSLQGRALDGIQADVLPMAGYSANEGDVITLHHLAGAVKLQIKMAEGEDVDHHAIRRVEISGNNNEQMAGDFLIDYENLTLTPAGTNAESKVVAEVNKDNAINGNVLTVFVIVPAREYTNGFTLRLIDKAGHYMDIASKAITVEKGEIKAMPAVEFKPTGTVIDTEIAIASAADWNTFVKDYNESKYTDVLVNVKLTQDIVFDDATNAEFATLAGTDNDYEFEGTIDGQNFAFKGLKSNKAIIHATSGAVVKNLVIDESCEFNFKDIVLTESTHLGGLANDVFASSFENITFNANVTYDNITAKGLGIYVYAGNLFGRTNGDCVVKNCTNNGNIVANANCHFGLNNGAIPAATVYLGGFVGYGRCLMENCTNNGNITSGWNAKDTAVAGIAGRMTGTGELVNCVNNGTITDNARRKPAAPIAINDYNRTHYVAGVGGILACNTNNCTNNGDVVNSTNIKTVYVGGVVAFTNSNERYFTGLTNTGDITSNDETRYLMMGGVIGYSKTQYTLTDLENSGKVEVTKIENTTSVTMDLGGIIGSVDYEVTIDGTSDINIVNKGDVLYNYNATNDYTYLSVGGIVGTAKKKVTIKNAKCENKVQLISNSGTNKNQTSYCGGIAGVVAAAGSTIENCTISNFVYSRERGAQQYDDVSTPLVAAQGFFCGGIVAYMYGENGVTSTINNCHNTCVLPIVSGSEGGIIANRGYVGGVVAYAKYTNITACSSTATMAGINTSVRLGGIAAYLDNSHITGCSVTSPRLYSYNNTYIGGIASGVNAGSSIKNSTFNGTIAAEGTILTCKAVASFTKAGAVIENCGVAGSVLGTALTAENFADHIVGDANTTPTGCYFLTE